MRPSLSLTDLATGAHAIIAGVHGPEAFSKRLNALGFSIGRRLSLVRRAGFGGPLHVRLGTTDVALRRAEASGITVRLVEPEPA